MVTSLSQLKQPAHKMHAVKSPRAQQQHLSLLVWEWVALQKTTFNYYFLTFDKAVWITPKSAFTVWLIYLIIMPNLLEEKR